jgi:hypothetical protein
VDKKVQERSLFSSTVTLSEFIVDVNWHILSSREMQKFVGSGKATQQICLNAMQRNGETIRIYQADRCMHSGLLAGNKFIKPESAQSTMSMDSCGQRFGRLLKLP